jgi:hypothetical protein
MDFPAVQIQNPNIAPTAPRFENGAGLRHQGQVEDRAAQRALIPAVANSHRRAYLTASGNGEASAADSVQRTSSRGTVAGSTTPSDRRRRRTPSPSIDATSNPVTQFSRYRVRTSTFVPAAIAAERDPAIATSLLWDRRGGWPRQV